MMTIPPEPHQSLSRSAPLDAEEEPLSDDNIFDLAGAVDAERRIAARLPPTIVHTRIFTAAPAHAAKSKPNKPSRPIARTVARSADDDFDSSVFIDKTRDIVTPIVMTLIGVILLFSFYLGHYKVDASKMPSLVAGLSFITLMQAVLLIVFAFIVAGPLGVGFGDVRTAWYKFIAVAVLGDGASVWGDHFMSSLGAGLLGFAFIGFIPTAMSTPNRNVRYFSPIEMSASAGGGVAPRMGGRWTPGLL